MLRIDKYLADCGIGTRSEVKKYIKIGKKKNILNQIWIKQKSHIV